MSKILHVMDKILSFFEEWVLFISTIMALLALFFNVILRYGFNYTLAWSEELVREVIILTTFIGLSAAIKARSMIKIDALVQLVPVLKTPLTFFSNVVTLIFSVMMVFYGWKMAVMQAATRQKTIILQIPLELLYAVLPIMGMLMLLRTLQVIHEDVKHLRARPKSA